jgi:hypothetical protein
MNDAAFFFLGFDVGCLVCILLHVWSQRQARRFSDDVVAALRARGAL